MGWSRVVRTDDHETNMMGGGGEGERGWSPSMCLGA